MPRDTVLSELETASLNFDVLFDVLNKTMLGPEVLDSAHPKEIVFKSTGAESTGQGQRRGK
jgi:hypothetical protein